MLNDELLEAFIQRFYGYGSYTALTWFIGMEEGGGHSEAEIAQRLHVWDDRHRHEVEDLAQYHAALGITRYFDAAPALQTTWAKLIRTQLAEDSSPISTSAIREFQRSVWGTWYGGTCLLELMPLPSRNLKHWPYGQMSAIPYLQSRETYLNTVVSHRIETMQQRILQYRPDSVVFYGMQYREWWERIAGVPLAPMPDHAMMWGENEDTNFLVLKHPAAVGATNAYYEDAGRLLRDRPYN
jgi:hypothetical protein